MTNITISLDQNKNLLENNKYGTFEKPEESINGLIGNRIPQDEETLSAASSSVRNSAELYEKQHFRATSALCLCTLTHAYLLISPFPYSGFMAVHLVPSLNLENAGTAAGLLSSFFMVGRAVSSVHWGKFSDKYGRKLTIQISLIFSLIFSLSFGLAPSFNLAICSRFILGMFNGIIGAAKTSVTELAKGNEKLEKKGTALVLGMWGWGFLMAPFISGALADPVKQYSLPLDEGKITLFLEKFPFFLPNLFGAFACILSLIFATYAVQETLPTCEQISIQSIFSNIQNHLKMVHNQIVRLLCGQFSNCIIKCYNISEMSEDYSLVDEEKIKEDDKLRILDHEALRQNNMQFENRTTVKKLWASRSVRHHLIIYWMWSFVTTGLDEAFPLLCLSKSGLNISELSIGKILSSAGVAFAICQYFVYNSMVDIFGLYGSIKVSIWVCIPTILLIPFSVLIQNIEITENSPLDSGGSQKVYFGTYLFLLCSLAARRIMSLVFFSSITITTNKTVSTSQRGTLNGLAMLGGSVSKALGAMFAGFMASLSFSATWIPTFLGPYILFVTFALFGMVSALFCNFFLRDSVIS